MTEEQKQALIEHCKLRIKVLQTYWHVNAEDMLLAKLDLEVYEIALAAMTAQPVKLPSGRLMQVAFETDPVNADMYLCISRDGAFAAIRAAGYQVEGE